ncbi:MAG: hypothetical protein NUV72_09730 [Bauldia sp.]|nr:hypothetical protein [Bauldia sp.]
MATTAERLVAVCIAAAAGGADFPAVWNTVLKRHPAVAGLPIQRMDGGTALLEVRLVTGERIVVGPGPRDYAVAPVKGDGAVI